MNPRILVALIASSIVPSSFAAPCTSVETASPENYESCPKLVKEAIFNSAPATTAFDLVGKVYSFHGSSNYFHLSAPGGEVCLTAQRDWYGESASIGTLAHLKAKKCTDITNNNPSAQFVAKTWKSLIMIAHPWGSIGTPMSLSYPISESEGSKIAHDVSLPVFARVEAFSGYTWSLSSAEKTLVLMDFVRDPAISNSNEVIPLVSELIRVSPDKERVSVTIHDLVTDSRIDRYRLSEVVYQVKGYVTPALSQAFADRVSDYSSKCSDPLNAAIFNVVPALSPALEYATANLMNSCKGSTGEFTNVSAASSMAVRLGMKSITLPLVDYLTRESETVEKSVKGNGGISDQYRSTFLSAIRALAYFRSPRALRALELPSYMNSRDNQIATEARKAIDVINAGIEIAQIRQGSVKSIQWGKDMISFHNGSAKAVQMEVIAAFKVAMKKYPSIVPGIKAFLKKEIAEGYHAYDIELVEAMKAASN